MREGWREVRLGDMATQNVSPFTVDPDTTYVNLGVQWYAGGTFAREPKLGSEMKATRLFEVRPGQFIYNRMFVTEGSFALVAQEHGGGVVSNEFPVFDLRESAILPGYLLLHFQQPSVWREIADKATGTTKSRRRWKEAQFLEYSIALPPLAEQRRIVDLVAAVDDAIAAAEGEAETTDRALTALVTRELSFNESGATPVIDLIEFMLGGAWGSPPGAEEVDVTALGPSAYKGGVTAVDPKVGTLRSLSEKRAADRSLRAGDIVLERSGGSPSQAVGRVIRMETDADRVVPSDFMRLLRVDRSKADPTYVFWALWCAYRTGRSLPFQKRTTSIFNLNIPSYLSGLKVNVPTPGEQHEVVALAEAAWSSYVAARTHAESLRALRSNLLSVLLSGEHEIPESYDHLLDLAEEGAAA